MRARTFAFAALLLVAACSRSLDTSGLEEQLLDTLQQRGGPPVTEVSCPDVDAEEGATFTCEATGSGATWTIEVTQLDDEGRIEWRIVGTSEEA